MKPLGNRLLLRPVDAPEKVGSLWLPPAAQADFTLCQATVVERGDGVRDLRLQPGARVIVKRFGKAVVGDDTFAIFEHDVLALIDVAAL